MAKRAIAAEVRDGSFTRHGSQERVEAGKSRASVQGKSRKAAESVRGKVMARRPDNSRMMAYMGLGITIVLNAATAGYTYGGVSTRLAAMEVAHAKMEKKVDDFRELATDMAVVKNQLVAIGATLMRLETTWGLSKGSGK